MPTKPAKPSKKPAKDPWDTPAMRQWRKIKERHPDCILFFRMGDFYELFGQDAENMSRDLGLSLTTRGSAIPLAGVPHHQKSTYLSRAIEMGYRVAVVDQLEDPKDAKGVVDRGVTQVVTPGTLVDESLLRDEQSVPMGAIVIHDEQHAGIAIVELSTGAFSLFDGSLEQCTDELGRLGVRELIFASPISGDPPKRVVDLGASINASLTPRPGWQFGQSEALEAIENQYRLGTIEGLGLDSHDPSVHAAGAMLRYLSETQAIDEGAKRGPDQQHASLAHLRPPIRVQREHHCLIDRVSLRSLEIEQTIREQSLAGSLAGVFLASPVGTRCVLHTPMGKRQVRSWLSAPLIDQGAINARLDAVESLTNSSDLREELGEVLGSMCDMARISGRIALGRATPRDLVALGGASVLIEELMRSIERCESLRPHHEALESIRDEVLPLGDEITRCCIDDAPAHLREGGLISDGIDPELDEARSLQRDAGKWLSEYQQKIINEHELPSLRVGYNKVFGFYIELPAAQARRAPDVFTRKQTLKNAERYITPELKEYEEKVLSAGDRANERERIIFDQLCERAREHLDALGKFSDIVATIDCLLGFATKASQRGWVRPKIVDEPTIEIVQGRHPVLDETLGHNFVPNDCTLAQDHSPATLALITGPNMAGKSTYIRQNALLVVLAQSGSFVPAAGATIGIATRIFTRVGADDALHRGQSTFMVEMIETANILNHADDRSLVILDEIGRGTSTLDGLSLAWAISEWLSEHRPRTLFATHYHEITELESRLEDRVKNLHVAVREWTSEDGNQEIAFLHSIRAGRADQSYGIHVAQLAGVPRQVTQRAKAVLESLSVEHAGRVDTKQVQAANKSAASAQMSLFTEFVQHPVVDSLKELKLDAMTPMQAFDALRAMQSQANDSSN
ncbi:MAG: DNA mismatch repair protein MutS [Phycisphaerales bacterium]|nr:DNA mismatch repair protein MutS [Phycisphaerales bacterium]